MKLLELSLHKKEKWKASTGSPYGKNADELALIDRFQELRNNEGGRKLSYAKVAEQLDKEGFKTRKGTKILYP